MVDEHAGASQRQGASRRRILIVVTVLAVVVLLGAGATSILAAVSDPPDNLALFVTGAITASAAAVNIVLTYFVLYSTQQQIALILRNSSAERSETAEQLLLARQQLDEARNQAQIARQENLTAQKLTTDSNTESIRARLDVLAPRVTMRRTTAELLFKERGAPSAVFDIPSLAELEESDGALIVQTTFEIKNWGDEPVALTMSNHWHQEFSYHQTLDPGEIFHSDVGPLFKDFVIPLAHDGLRRHAREGWPGRAASENPWHHELTISAINVDATVQDDLTWRGSIRLYNMTEAGKLQGSTAPLLNDIPMAHRQRHYVNLERESE